MRECEGGVGKKEAQKRNNIQSRKVSLISSISLTHLGHLRRRPRPEAGHEDVVCGQGRPRGGSAGEEGFQKERGRGGGDEEEGRGAGLCVCVDGREKRVGRRRGKW